MRQFTIRFLKALSFLSVFCLLCGSISFSARAQVRPVYDYGAIGLGQLLKRLNTTKSVMMIGAHPDDEDSALLAYLARGENARTAYLSLTRGDGGQNIIGSELFESLGIIRTEELLQARRLDGAEQLFTRAYDFGFTKTLAETKEKWDEKIILCDAVRAIRSFRPLVVISRFSGTPADGHGQHQFAGYISPLAVRAAADASQCAEAGAPWQILKFYVGQSFRSTAEPGLKINTGEYDFLLGRSYFEIAIEGRSQHRTQEQGGLELRGDQFSGLNLVETKAPKIEKETSIFDGIDDSITAIPKLAGFSAAETSQNFTTMQNSAARALREYQVNEPQKLIAILAEGHNAAGEASAKLKKILKDGAEAARRTDFYVARKQSEFSEAIKIASGIRIDVLADRETAAPDESFQITAKIFYPRAENIEIKEAKINAPNGWEVSKTEKPKEAAPVFRREAANETFFFGVKVPKTAEPTEPYWLENPRIGDLYVWRQDENQNQPFQKPIVSAETIVAVGGTQVVFNQPVQYRFADDIRGELRRDLNVVPKISLSLDQNLLIVPQSRQAQTRKIVLSITNNSSSAVNGEARLNLPAQLKVLPQAANFNLKNKGEKTSAAFDVTIPAESKIGDFELGAQARAGGETFTGTMHEIAYPHIQTHRFYTDAKTKVVVLDLKVAPVRVGYIMGSGDTVPEAIRQMGLTVDLLNENDLTNGDLSRFDTIVVGIRAFQVRQDLISNNQRLNDFVKTGGTLIVQYQRPDYVQQNLQPFPASMTDTQKTTAGTTARVVDENAKVTILDTKHPVFNFPNEITDADFSGWVQERNLYNFATFDRKYTPLLESHDAGEAENKGGLVVADIGKGKYIYCSYAFFRQLPAGVPGAYRLFANLLSLQNSEKLKTKSEKLKKNSE